MFFSGKSQRFLKIRVLFWPEISVIGVFLNFDNERMHPPKYLSDPPGTYRTHSAGISSYQPNDSAWCMCPSRRVLQPVYRPSINDARH